MPNRPLAEISVARAAALANARRPVQSPPRKRARKRPRPAADPAAAAAAAVVPADCAPRRSERVRARGARAAPADARPAADADAQKRRKKEPVALLPEPPHACGSADPPSAESTPHARASPTAAAAAAVRAETEAEPASPADGREERLEDAVVRNVLAAPTAVSRRFLEARQAGDIDAFVREIVVDWLMEVAAEYDARAHTLALAVSYMDRVLGRVAMARDQLQLLAVVCMFIACKVEETDAPSISDVMFICDNNYDRGMVQRMERRVLVELEFRLTAPTAFSAVRYIATRMRRGGRRLVRVAEFAAHVALLDAELAAERAGVVAMACVLVAMRIEGLDASCLDECPDCVLHVCGKEAGLAALRVFEMWCRIRRRHNADHSRWLVLRWPHIAELFVAVADGALDERKPRDADDICRTKRQAEESC